MSDIVGYDDLQPGDVFIDHYGKVFTVTDRYDDMFWYTHGIHRLADSPQGDMPMRRSDWPDGKAQLRLYRAEEQ